MSAHPAEHKGRRVVAVRSVAEWHDWLLAEGQTSAGVWLTVWKQAAPPELPRYEELVQEAVCHGWIDSTVNSFDETSYLMLVAPRKVGSPWSASNKARIEQLSADGRLYPSGQAVIERAKADGSWTLLDSVEAMIEPDDLVAALDVAGVREAWDAMAPSKRKMVLASLAVAKTAATRTTRLDQAIADLRDA